MLAQSSLIFLNNNAKLYVAKVVLRHENHVLNGSLISFEFFSSIALLYYILINATCFKRLVGNVFI